MRRTTLSRYDGRIRPARTASANGPRRVLTCSVRVCVLMERMGSAAFRPEGTALSKPRVSPCELCEQRRRPRYLSRIRATEKHPLPLPAVRPAAMRRVDVIAHDGRQIRRQFVTKGIVIQRWFSVLRRERNRNIDLSPRLWHATPPSLGPPLRGYSSCIPTVPGQRQRSRSSRCLTLGFDSIVPAGLRKRR